MTPYQQQRIEQHLSVWSDAAERIGTLGLSPAWVEIFTDFILDRCFRHLGDHHIRQMQTIADTDSPAVKMLAMQDKKVGLTTLEEISVQIPDEEVRGQAVTLILTFGLKESRPTLDLLMAGVNSTPSLFDQGGL